MPEHVAKIDSKEISHLKQILLRNKEIKEIEPTNPYEVFRLKCENAFIVGYASGKIVATDESIRHYLSTAILDLHAPDYDIMIGSDEAGKGEWLGPLVIVAVALTPSQSSILRAEGIMDSKELSTAKIIRLAKTIRQISTTHKVVLVSPQKFNERMKELKKENRSLNDLMAWGHARAIDTIYKDFRGKRLKIKVVIDEFDKLKTELRLQRWINLDELELIQKPRAEEEIAVAAASIIARSEWEEWVDKTAEKYGINLRKLTTAQILDMRQAAQIFAKIDYIKKNKAGKMLGS